MQFPGMQQFPPAVQQNRMQRPAQGARNGPRMNQGRPAPNSGMMMPMQQGGNQMNGGMARGNGSVQNNASRNQGAYRGGVRSMPQQGHPQMMQQQSNQLTAQQLAKMDPASQRQAIGERLFPIVQSNPLVQHKHKDMAGKITGMLLEMDGK